jgi:hypothetical protein
LPNLWNTCIKMCDPYGSPVQDFLCWWWILRLPKDKLFWICCSRLEDLPLHEIAKVQGLCNSKFQTIFDGENQLTCNGFPPPKKVWSLVLERSDLRIPPHLST